MVMKEGNGSKVRGGGGGKLETKTPEHLSFHLLFVSILKKTDLLEKVAEENKKEKKNSFNFYKNN